MWPTAVVTSDLVGMDTKSEELDESDPVHIASDWYTNIGNMKDIKEGGEISYQWLNQYKKNKNLAKSIIDNPTTKINAAEAGVSVGNFRRTTRGKIKNGLAEMGNIGNKAKAAGKFEVPYVDVIIDVGVGSYISYNSWCDYDYNYCNCRTYRWKCCTRSWKCNWLGSRNTCRNCSSEFRQFRFRWKWKIIKG